jgi:predicted secreted protein
MQIDWEEPTKGDRLQGMRHSRAFTTLVKGFALAFVVLMLVVWRIDSMGASSDSVVVTVADTGKTVSLVVGQSLIVKRDAQKGSTGFEWEPDAASSSLLSLSSIAHGGTSVLGGMEAQSLTFVAISAGEGDLKLVYRGPWEKDTPPAKNFSVTAKIAAH